jgi:hypothetical protein
LCASIPAFLRAMLAKRRPTPLIEVKAYMTFLLPSMLVLQIRKM